MCVCVCVCVCVLKQYWRNYSYSQEFLNRYRSSDSCLIIAILCEILVVGKSDLSDKIKQKFFSAIAMSVLLYSWTPLTVTKRTEKKLDGTYTRMLYAILNKSWKQHPYKPPKRDKKWWWTNKRCSPVNSYVWTHKCWPTNKNIYFFQV